MTELNFTIVRSTRSCWNVAHGLVRHEVRSTWVSAHRAASRTSSSDVTPNHHAAAGLLVPRADIPCRLPPLGGELPRQPASNDAARHAGDGHGHHHLSLARLRVTAAV